jgi:hypothetical protein
LLTVSLWIIVNQLIVALLAQLFGLTPQVKLKEGRVQGILRVMRRCLQKNLNRFDT